MKLTVWLGVLLVLCLVHGSLGASDDHATPTTPSDKCHHEEVVSSDVRVATLKLEEVKLPLIFGTFIIVTILAKMGKVPVNYLIKSDLTHSCVQIYLNCVIIIGHIFVFENSH